MASMAETDTTDISESLGQFLQIRGYRSDSTSDDENLFKLLQTKSGKEVTKLIIDEHSDICVVEYESAEDAQEVYDTGMSELELSHPVQNEVEEFLPVMYQDSVLTITGLQPWITRDALFYFLENEKKSGGGEVIDLTIDKLRVASVIMASPNVAARLLTKLNVTLEGAALDISKSQMDFDTSARICVTGIHRHTTKETIESFFSNTSSSGVGEITNLEYNPDEGKAVITFKEMEATERIMKKGELELEDAKLDVSWAAKRRMHHSLPIYYLDSSRDKEDGSADATVDQNAVTLSSRDVNTRLLPGTMRVTLIKGSMADENVNIIVNTTSSALQLFTSGVSGAIVRAAGSSIQKECKLKYPNGIEEGEFAITSGGQMSCKRIYHCASPGWDGIKGTSAKVLGTMFRHLLERAQNEEATSIAFPALGAGNLGYPPAVVAKLMYDELVNFIKEAPKPVIRDVHIVVYPRDTETVKAFQQYFKENGVVLGKPYFEKSRSKMGPTADDTRKNVAARETRVRIGSVTLTVKQGDITTENTDAIINSTTANFGVKGAVSRAIVKAAGNTVIEECKALGKINKGFAVTQAGNLPCIFIFHIEAPKDINSWKQLIIDVLADANKMNLQSISFPALGTGALKLKPDDMAKIMIRAVMEYSRKKLQTLLKINICIYQAEMMYAFEEVAKQEEHKLKPWSVRFLQVFKTDQRERRSVGRQDKSQSMQQLVRPNVIVRRSDSPYEPVDEDESPETARPIRRAQTDPEIEETIESLQALALEQPSVSHRNARSFHKGLPMEWKQMVYTEKFYRIRLEPTDNTYLEVSGKFHDTGDPFFNFSILEIERIQNPTFYNLYEVQKYNMEVPNEQILWHGTSPDVIDRICANGFNRSFSGKNAAQYGYGCYFTPSRDVAAMYADADSKDLKYIYMCKVLVGEYTKGEREIHEPPPKDPKNKYILYDSVVDDMEKPKIYVIFKDGVAYPEYLITFKEIAKEKI